MHRLKINDEVICTWSLSDLSQTYKTVMYIKPLFGEKMLEKRHFHDVYGKDNIIV